MVRDGIKERLINGLSAFGRLRIQVSHGSIIAYSALILILFVAFTIRILPLRWEIPSGTVLLNEFDPYYQFSITRYMVQNGLLSPYWPTPWINPQQWYPAGLDMSTSLPSLPMTAAVLYNIVSIFGVNIDLMTFTALLPAFLGMISVLILYFIGKDMGGRAVGLFSALFLALAPSFLQRSSLGFFDTEIPGVLGLLLFIFLFLRANDSNRSLRSSVLYSLGSGAALAYFIGGWGAAYYLAALTALFVFVMIALKRYSQRLLLTYSITFGLGLLIATKIPYIGLRYLTSAPIIPVAGVFLLLLVAEILRNNISARTKLLLTISSIVVIIGGFISLWLLGYLGNIAGKFISVINPFAREASPLIASVAEQRISAWGNLYIELSIGIVFFLVGLYFTLKNPTNRNIFILLYSATALYFATSMVRLLVILAPAFGILMATGILGTLKPFFTLLKEAPNLAVKTKRRVARVSKEYSGLAVFLIFIIVVTNFAFSPQTGGMPRVVSQAYVPTAISASSLPIAPNEQAQEWLNALSWTKNNLASSTVVVSWWDYGYWLSILGNVTTLADNGTVNATQIQNIGYIMMSNETDAMRMLSNYDQQRTKYILVFTVLFLQQSSSQQGQQAAFIASPAGLGDEGKWFWMARISGQARQRFLDTGYMTEETAWTDETAFGASNPQTGQFEWTDKGMNSTIYKLMGWAKQRYTQSASTIFGVQITPDVQSVQPTYFKEAYFAGLETQPGLYGPWIPLVAIYEIDWQAYNNAVAAS